MRVYVNGAWTSSIWFNFKFMFNLHCIQLGREDKNLSMAFKLGIQTQ